MKSYSIYCTKEQTSRAHKLGAPITVFTSNIHFEEHFPERFVWIEGEGCAQIPTAEQMCGWLRSKDINAHVGTDAYVCDSWSSFIQEALVAEGDKKESWWLEAESYEIFNTYEEAMMHAIDAALSKLEEYEHSTDTADGGSQS